MFLKISRFLNRSRVRRGLALGRNACSSYSDFKLNNTSLESYIKHLHREYEGLQKEKLTNSVSGRINMLQPIIELIEERTTVLQAVENLQELLNEQDQEMKQLAQEESRQFEAKIKVLNEELLENLLSSYEDEGGSVLLEVNAGVGGQEAMLFAGELFEMYVNFAGYKGWSAQVAEYSTTELGGLRHGSALIDGKSAFKYFKYEAGVHRVQRIPVTERAGRVHTSTVSVLVLPQPTEIEIQLDSKDLRIETKRASGAGGQHVNTTDSAVRITHIPSSISVECQTDRSQLKNKEMAMQRLKALLYQSKMNEREAELEATKKQQVRSNYRNEKIRTYNYSQDRITDHRLTGANVHNLKGFLNGGEGLDKLIDKLRRSDSIESLLRDVSQIKS